jgi:hypothetical protein
MKCIPLVALLSGCGALTSYQGLCTSALSASYLDEDGDGFGDGDAEETCGIPAGRAAEAGDCDDADVQRFPGNPETCDAIDNDCNDEVDEGLPTSEYFVDADGDGAGDPAAPVQSCGPVGDRVSDGTDCDDSDPANAPGLDEVCDGGDNDCDALADDDDDSVDESTMTSWWRDADGDGYGYGNSVDRCAASAQYTVQQDGDCDDDNAAINPGADELCAPADEDCDGLLGEDDPSIDPADLTTFWPDDDQDGLGDMAAVPVDACVAPNRHVPNDDDCDDTRIQVGGPVQMWSDADSDGYGNGVNLGTACPPAIPGQIEAGGPIDCNDASNAIHPGAAEVCGDGIDQDCVAGDLVCTPIGSYLVNDGPGFLNNPPVYSCLEACALIFGGVAGDYECSTSGAFVDNQAFVSGWGDATYCVNPVAETYQFEQAASPGYHCGFPGCAYSAYVADWCQNGARNWCWPN